jgi:hypothetical protein
MSSVVSSSSTSASATTAGSPRAILKFKGLEAGRLVAQTMVDTFDEMFLSSRLRAVWSASRWAGVNAG